MSFAENWQAPKLAEHLFAYESNYKMKRSNREFVEKEKGREMKPLKLSRDYSGSTLRETDGAADLNSSETFLGDGKRTVLSNSGNKKVTDKNAFADATSTPKPVHCIDRLGRLSTHRHEIYKIRMTASASNYNREKAKKTMNIDSPQPSQSQPIKKCDKQSKVVQIASVSTLYFF